MLKNTHAILLPAILALACNQKSQVEKTTKASCDFSLTRTASLTQLSVDSVTSNVSKFLTYYDDGKNASGYLFSVNTFMNELQIYDLESKVRLKSIPVEMNGERGVGTFKAVHVADFENILLFPDIDNVVYIIDTAGTKFQKTEYDQPVGYRNAVVSSNFFAASPHYAKDKLVVKTLYQANYRTISNKELSRKHIAYTINLKTGNTEMMPHYFPNDYFKRGMKHYEFSAVHSADGAVYSFFGDHHLYYSKAIDKPLQKTDARSKYLKRELEKFPADGGGAARGRYFSTSGHYGNLIHDPYRKVYYRFCYPVVEIDDVKALRSNIQFPAKFSVMILDENLNIMGETLFDKNSELVPQNAFVGKKGLYMSVNHPESALNQESKFSFDLLSLKRISDK